MTRASSPPCSRPSRSTANTPRVQVNLDYQPIARIYEGGSSNSGSNNQSRFTQNFNGRALGTVVPENVFVDLRADASEQARFGNSGPSSTTTLNTNDTTQNYSVAFSPYALHRFDGTGTGEVGYGFAKTVQDSNNLNASQTSGNPLLAQALNSIGNQNVTTQNLHAAFVTGEDFGRYNAAALATGTSYDGTGVLRNAHRYIFSVDNGYAITRTITGLARVGYEDIRYTGTSPVNIQDAIWDAGLRLTPDADTSVTARYGHHDGFNSLTFLGSASPTARTRVYAQYSAGLETQLEGLQNALASTDLDALGTPVDHTTGVPLYSSEGNEIGTQGGLYKIRRLSVGGQLLLDRDVIAISINNDDRKLVSSPSLAAAAVGAVSSNKTTSASISWSHELMERLTSIAYFQYGIRSGAAFATLSRVGPNANNTDNYTLSLSTSYQFTETITGTASYSYSSDELGSVGFQNSSGGQNRFLVGLRKTF